jgi:hypothetical protein
MIYKQFSCTIEEEGVMRTIEEEGVYSCVKLLVGSTQTCHTHVVHTHVVHTHMNHTHVVHTHT